MAEPELITLGEAQRRLETSKNTIARLVKEGRLTVFHNALDRRQKLVDAAQVEELRRPQRGEPEGKATA
jgi:predicted DNA-binding protein (UPF0251 family)